MVSAYIFLLHIIAAVCGFIIYKKVSTGEGFLAVAFIGIVFAVCWTISSILTNLLFSIEWFEKWFWQPLDSWILIKVRKEINRDTISLIILTLIEVIFYYFYFLKDTNNTPKTDSSAQNPV